MIKPIEGFYVHDEETNTDGVAKVSIDAVHELVEDLNGAVEGWLDEHPEATTTVQDGAITSVKINDSVSITTEEIDDMFTLKELAGVKKVDFEGSAGITSVWYSIIPSNYKPDLYLANNRIDTVQNAVANAVNNNLILSVNAGLFDTSTNATRGYTIVNGSVKKSTAYETSNRGEYLYMTRDGTLDSIDDGSTLEQVTELNPRWCVLGWTSLVKGGEYLGEWDTDVHPRSFIGQNQKGDYIVGATGGRGEGGVGFTSADINNFCESVFDTYFLYCLDGGGSVSIVLNGVRVNPLIDGEDRDVANFIGWR